jgi:hypothetical protein
VEGDRRRGSESADAQLVSSPGKSASFGLGESDQHRKLILEVSAFASDLAVNLFAQCDELTSGEFC